MKDHPSRIPDALIAQLVRARAADPDIGLLDDIVNRAAATPQAQHWLGRPVPISLRTVLLVAVLLMALAGAIAIGSRLRAPDPSVDLHLPIVSQVVDAVNARDAQGVESLFSPDGTVVLLQIESTGDRLNPLSEWPVHLESFAEGWMVDSVDRWGLEVEVEACRTESELAVACDVVTRWHTLQVDAIEEWTFTFNDSEVTRLETVRVDREPETRSLPLRHRDLASWEAWLEATHPAEAQQILTGDWRYWYFYFPYATRDPGDNSPIDVRGLIDEYLQTR